MDKSVLKTSADDLYELVRSKKKISIDEAAKILRIPVKTVHSLVDFLVEEKIFGIEYKFTTPYIYIGQEHPKRKVFQVRSEKEIVTKDEFFEKARKWNVSYEKVNGMWKKYIDENISKIKVNFYSKARSRNMTKEQIDKSWERYLSHLQ